MQGLYGLISKPFNARSNISSRARDLNFGLILHLPLYFACADPYALSNLNLPGSSDCRYRSTGSDPGFLERGFYV